MLGFCVQYWVNNSVKESYIDEYFHLGMTEKYLNHLDFLTWDPKITTPPGLYYLGFIFGNVLSIFGFYEDATSLRYLNR